VSPKEDIVAETNPPKPAARDTAPTDASAAARAGDKELTDEQLDKVSGGSMHNVLKLRHDTAKNNVGN
jgi:bacteriocin-like protein